MVTPEGFEQYYVLVTPNGKILQIPSCSVVKVDVFDERELQAALDGPEPLGKTLERFDADDLAPLIRKGLGERVPAGTTRLAEQVGKIWRQERPAMERLGQIVSEVSIEDMVRALVDLGADAHSHPHS